MKTAIASIEEELQDCIAQLDVSQKKSLLELIKSFVKNDKKEIESQDVKNHDQELKEPDKEYQIKESLSNETHLIEMNGWIGKPQTIEEYNKELEAAVAEVKAGAYYSHEEVKEMAENW